MSRREMVEQWNRDGGTVEHVIVEQWKCDGGTRKQKW